MTNKICSIFVDPLTKETILFYNGKIMDSAEMKFRDDIPTAPSYAVYLSYKGRNLPGLLITRYLCNGWHATQMHKPLVEWCIENRDITDHLFKKYNVEPSSIDSAFCGTEYGGVFEFCIDRKWMLLLDDIIQHSEFIGTKYL